MTEKMMELIYLYYIGSETQLPAFPLNKIIEERFF